MPLFEVAVLEIATKKEVEEGADPEKLVFGPTTVLAKDGSTAGLKALKTNAEKMASINFDKAQVIVRPFA